MNQQISIVFRLNRIASTWAPTIALAIVSAAPVLASVFVANEMSCARDERSLIEFSVRATRQADMVHGQVLDALQSAQAIPSDPCSSSFLEAIGRIALSYRYVSDVGALADERYLCTSRLGVTLADEVPFPHSKAPPNPYTWIIWHQNMGVPNKAALFDYRGRFVTVDPAMYVDLVDLRGREIAVFDSNTQRLLAMTPNADAQTMRSSLRSRSPSDGTPPPEAWRSLVAHSKAYPLSIVVRAQTPGLLIGSLDLLLLWGFAGAAAGGTAAWAACRMFRRHQSLPHALRTAIRHKRLDVHYQPIVNMSTRKTVGVEALVRWHRGLESISPAVFVPIAEQYDLIQPLTELVMRKALNELAPLLATSRSLYVSINVSMEELQTQRFLNTLNECCEKHSISREQIKVEATERRLMSEAQAKLAIDALRDAGYAVLIDDFGTGYSNLSYLNHFKVDGLKVDKSFVEKASRETAADLLVTHIASMAQALDLLIVAEGVETEEQARYLRSKGISYAQGWHYARAMSVGALITHLNQADR
ncbi:EAL domain-containing protein [Pandoraea apista]|uniref:EAL domain-containing protein n=1 Tax=Pandoraea apista TaxID=93218 RepID=UPI000F65917B|nr:EAL domain-containing protein [Pandoraea apista]RRW87877.1 EAL domain-containing protein [Pandoraea apista]RRW96267.1 EAL domain-containing protein [Pandoraea apista]